MLPLLEGLPQGTTLGDLLSVYTVPLITETSHTTYLKVIICFSRLMGDFKNIGWVNEVVYFKGCSLSFL